MELINDVISVIVPVYRVEKFLDDCVRSIVGQTYQKLQIILVDDGSPDRCGEMCEQWAKKDKRIQVVHKKNGGLSDARNAGLAVAVGEYIAFVDSDDWIDPHMYEIMLQALVKEKADLAACGIVDTFSDREIVHSTLYSVGGSEKFLYMIYHDTTFPVAAWNKLYRRTCWEDFEFPKGKICEDAFTTYLLVDRAEKIVQIPEALYHYRIRESSIMTTAFRTERMDEEEAWRCNYLYMKENHPDLAKAAYDFYLQKVKILFCMIPAEKYSEFSKEYEYLYNILKNNLTYILFQSDLSWKYRIYFLTEFFKMKRKRDK